MAVAGVIHLLETYCIPFVLLLVVASLLRNKFKPGLSDIPGPPLAAFTKLWRLHDVWQGQSHWTAISLHRKHGKLVRIAPNVVSVGDPDEIPNLYNTKAEFTKSGFYPIQSVSWHGKPQMNIFSTGDEADHREQKKKVASAYTLESLLRMEPAIDGCIQLLIARLGEFADRGKPVDLGTWLQYYCMSFVTPLQAGANVMAAFDVVGELTFQKKFGFLEKGGDVDNMMSTLDKLLVYGSVCGQVPEAHPYLAGNPILPFLIPQMETWNQVMNFTLKAVNNRTKLAPNGELELEEGRVGDDMLSKWAAVKASDPLKMNTRDVVVNLSVNVFAGSDTTAIALRAILYFLIKNTNKLKKLQKEIDDVDNAGKISNPISDKESRQELPYLQAVEKEAMRLHPSIGLLLERHVPAGGATICGKQIPGGTIVGINPWVLAHDPEIFPDPEKFEPERWLDSSKEQLAQMEKSFLNFGAGKRVCLGMNISLIEMRKTIPQLLREFDITIEGDKEWKVRNVWFIQQDMPPCVLKRRRRS